MIYVPNVSESSRQDRLNTERICATDMPLPLPIALAREIQSKHYRQFVSFSRHITTNEQPIEYCWKLLKQVHQTEKSILQYEKEVSQFCISHKSRHWVVEHIANANAKRCQHNLQLLKIIKICTTEVLKHQHHLKTSLKITSSMLSIQKYIENLDVSHLSIEKLISEIYCYSDNTSYD